LPAIRRARFPERIQPQRECDCIGRLCRLGGTYRPNYTRACMRGYIARQVASFNVFDNSACPQKCRSLDGRARCCSLSLLQARSRS
jgi:hypothetical protein